MKFSKLLQFILFFFKKRQHDLRLIFVFHLMIESFFPLQGLKLFLKFFLMYQKFLMLSLPFLDIFFNTCSFFLNLLLMLELSHLFFPFFKLLLFSSSFFCSFFMSFFQLCPFSLDLFYFLFMLFFGKNFFDFNMQRRFFFSLLSITSQLLIQILNFFLHLFSLSFKF